MDEPKTALMHAWWNHAQPFVTQSRDQGWPIMATLVQTKDGRTLALLALDLGGRMTVDEAAVASPLPIEVDE